MKEHHTTLHSLEPNVINELALGMLDMLLERCTVNLVSQLTGITRKTLYRWLDTSVPLEAMDHRDSAWFILVCETSPRVKMLLARPPLSNRHLAKRLTDEVKENEQSS